MMSSLSFATFSILCHRPKNAHFIFDSNCRISWSILYFCTTGNRNEYSIGFYNLLGVASHESFAPLLVELLIKIKRVVKF